MSHEKFTTAELENKAERIMDNFDFAAVHKHMVQSDWKWADPNGESQVPDILRIKVVARYLLTKAIWDSEPVANAGTGGFTAYKLPWGLQLTFQIQNSHA
jgi:hypothetical protein